MVAMGWWLSGRVFGSAFCVAGSISSGGRSQYNTAVRPNKVETDVQCFRRSRASVRRIFCHGNSIPDVIPLLKKENVRIWLPKEIGCNLILKFHERRSINFALV